MEAVSKAIAILNNDAAFEAFAIDEGSWQTAAHLIPIANPMDRKEFGGTPVELQRVYKYKKALGELRSSGKGGSQEWWWQPQEQHQQKGGKGGKGPGKGKKGKGLGKGQWVWSPPEELGGEKPEEV